MSEKFFSRTVEEMETIFNKAENAYSNEYIDEITEDISNIETEISNYNSSKVKSDVALNLSTLGYTSKNLLKTNAASLIKNGITFTVNADGSVTVNGTATAKTDFVSFIGAPAEAMYYAKLKLSGCPLNGSAETYRMFIQDLTSGYATLGVDTGNGASVTINRNVTQIRCFITIYEGYTAENLTFYPMLRYEDIADVTYEPYKPSVEERLAALEAAIIGGGEA